LFLLESDVNVSQSRRLKLPGTAKTPSNDPNHSCSTHLKLHMTRDGAVTHLGFTAGRLNCGARGGGGTGGGVLAVVGVLGSSSTSSAAFGVVTVFTGGAVGARAGWDFDERLDREVLPDLLEDFLLLFSPSETHSRIQITELLWCVPTLLAKRED